MSATSNAYRIAGPTYAISVTASQSTALAVFPGGTNDSANYAIFQNTGSTVVCVVVAPLPANQTAVTPGLAFPVPGTPTVPNSFILPAAPGEIVVVVPTGGFSVSAIGSGAGPSVVYVGYVEQS